MEGKYNRKVMIANKPIHSHNRGPNHWLLIEYGFRAADSQDEAQTKVRSYSLNSKINSTT